MRNSLTGEKKMKRNLSIVVIIASMLSYCIMQPTLPFTSPLLWTHGVVKGPFGCALQNLSSNGNR